MQDFLNRFVVQGAISYGGILLADSPNKISKKVVNNGENN